MAAVDAVEWEAALLEPLRNRDAERFVRKHLGVVPPGARYFLDSLWVTHARVLLSIGHVPMLYLSPDLAGMLALVVSQEGSCRYCYAATRSVMKILGFAEARIRRLEEDFLSTDLSTSEKAALEFARSVARAAPLVTGQHTQPLLAAGYPVDAVKEIACLAAINVFFNRLSTLPALPPDEVNFAERWHVRLFRPLIAPYLRPRQATRGERLRPEQREGPFAAFVNALDGLPMAARLRSAIDEAWRPSALGQRAKALVVAVVARGIGCPSAERESVRLLAAEGFTEAEIGDALAHLSTPDLDPLERAAASLARESIWPQPAPLQRHVRSLRPLFTREQFVELLAVAALANTICRLTVALDLAPPDA
jgi:alkylhydroperoxidase family enzyme